MQEYFHPAYLIARQWPSRFILSVSRFPVWRRLRLYFRRIDTGRFFAIQDAIIPGGRVTQRFQVGKDDDIGQCAANVLLDTLHQLVSPLDVPHPGNQDMKGYKPAGARLTSANCVVLNSCLPVRLQYIADQGLLIDRQSRVHKAQNGLPYNVDACPDDVRSNNKCNSRVQTIPAGENYGNDPHHDTNRSPHIRHQMIGVRFQGD